MIATAVLTGLFWVAVAYHAPAFVRGRRDPTFRAYWLGAFSLALAFTFTLPWLNRGSPDSRTWADLTALAVDGFTVTAVGCSLYDVLRTVAGPRASRVLTAAGVGATGVALTAMIVLFLVAHPAGNAIDFYRDYGSPWVAAYRATFLLYLGLAIPVLGGLWFRRMIRQPYRTVRIGMTMMVAGTAFGLAYVADDAVLIAKALGWPGPGRWGTPAEEIALMALSIGLVLIGALTPVWARLVMLARMHLALSRLHNLWKSASALDGREDDLLGGQRWRERFDLEEVTLRLVGVVGEIRDVIAWSGRDLPPQVIDRATRRAGSMSLDERKSAALMDASALHARTGHPEGFEAEEAVAPRENPTLKTIRYEPDGFWDEIRYFERVALYWRRLCNERSPSGGAIPETHAAPHLGLQRRVTAALLSTLRRVE